MRYWCDRYRYCVYTAGAFVLAVLMAFWMGACQARGADTPPVVLPGAPVATPTTLVGNQVYPITCNVDCVVRVYPPGVVTPPSSVRKVVKEGTTFEKDANFVDGTTTKSWQGSCVLYFLQPVGKGKVYVDVIPKGFTSEDQIVSFVLDVDAGAGPRPPPEPKPPEPKPPEPKPPDPGSLGLAKVSRDGLAKVADPEARAELAAAQRAHASAVAAGVFGSPAAILAGWRAANNKVVPLDRLLAWQGKWKPWAADVSAKLQELHGAGKLTDNVAWAKAFNEIADGLEAK